MSRLSFFPARETGETTPRIINASSIARVISLAVLVVSQIICLDVATSWAVAEWMGMHGLPEYVFGAILLLPALYVSAWFTLLAWDAETSPENNL